MAAYGDRKHSIFDEDGKVKKPKEGAKRTICTTHIVLADVVAHANISPEEKRAVLDLIDEVYDMGKRMGTKLRDYHNEFVALGKKKKGGWRENF